MKNLRNLVKLGSKNHLLGTDKFNIGTGKEVLDFFIVKVHVLDENFHEIW